MTSWCSLIILVVLLIQAHTNTLLNSQNVEETVENDSALLATNGNWWEVNQTTDSIFDAYKNSRIYLRTVDLDETKLHTCYEYKVVDKENAMRVTHSDTFCYPSIIITGHRKCSTSALYNLFTQYPGVIHNQINVKENCAYIGDKSLTQYFDSLPRNVEIGEVIVDGCIDLKGNMKMRKLLRDPNAFYLVVLRDYSDWIWSAYNYWCQPDYDGPECFLSSHWVDVELHHRSPETFHDIVMGSINGTHVASPLLFKKPCDEGASIFRRFVSTLWASVPVENTLVLASEQLEANPEYVWQRISASIGLSSKHPKLKEFSEVRYNTQAQKLSKGENVVMPADKVKPGLYAVSKFKPLLDSTREVLDRCWRDDCLWSASVTGYSFSACSAAKLSTLTSAPVTTAVGTPASILNSTEQYLSVSNASFADPFLGRKVRECKARFGMRRTSAAADSAATESNMFGSTVISREMSGKIGKSLDQQQQHKVLILSLSAEDRHYVKKMLFYAARFHSIVDTDASYNDTDVSRCAPSDPPPDVVCTSPKHVRPSKSDPMLLELRQNDRSDMGCVTHHNVVFSKVVVIVTDSLRAFWSSYQSSLGVNSALDPSAMVHFNWSRWEGAAVDMVRQNSVANGTVWSAEQSAMMDRLLPANKMMMRIEDLKYSSNRLRLLYDIIRFVAPDTRTVLSTTTSALSGDALSSADPAAKYVVTKDSLQCAQLLTNTRMLQSADSMTSKANLELAYASEDLVCKITKLYEKSSLQLSTLQPAVFNTSCVNGLNTKPSIGRKCKLRYSRKAYLSTVTKHPVVLLSTHGYDSVNTRLLIEHATGVYSGSMETNRKVADLLHGEGFCGQRLSVIQANPHDVTIKNQRSGAGVVSLTNQGTKKCKKGMVRGFSQALLVVRDPYAAVWFDHRAQLKSVAAGSGSGWNASVAVNAAELLSTAKNYRRGRLEVSHAYDRLHENNFAEKDVLVVSFEALINPRRPGNSSAASSASSASRSGDVTLSVSLRAAAPLRNGVLQQILAFAHFPEIYPERLECAFRFMEAVTEVQDVALMNAFYLAHIDLLCEMRKIFSERLNGGKFQFIGLYDDVPCI